MSVNCSYDVATVEKDSYMVSLRECIIVIVTSSELGSLNWYWSLLNSCKHMSIWTV